MLTPRLKNDNWALHQIAERQPTPGTLIKGTMPIEGYKAALAQQLLVNRVLDDLITAHRQSNPTMADLIKEDQLLTQYLLEDLHFFEIDPDTIEPSVGTQRYIDHIRAHKDDHWHLLGLHYVRLGACNGNSFVARVVRKAYALGDVLGTRYLDPFGKAQRKGWTAFKDGIDALDIDQAAQDAIFEGTRAAYVQTINLDFAEFKDADTLLREHGQSLDKAEFDEHHSVHLTKEMHASLDD
ncbi:MAG: biliverdin-producing heme oxygenase [Phycisphaerales bacterium]